jgi:hypothetical protein
MTDAEWKKFEKMGPELRRKAGWKASGTTEEGVEIGDLFWKVSKKSERADERCTCHYYLLLNETHYPASYPLIYSEVPPPCLLLSSPSYPISCSTTTMSLSEHEKRSS